MTTLLLILCLFLASCMPPGTRIEIEGNYADYSYSAKSGIHIKPKLPVVAGRKLTITPEK